MKLSKNDQLALEEFKNALVEKFADRIERIVLYGSAARGKMDKDSDIDVVVVVRDERPRIKDKYGLTRVLSWNNYPVEEEGLNLAYDIFLKYWSHISPQVVDKKEYLDPTDPFFYSVRKEGKTLWTSQ